MTWLPDSSMFFDCACLVTERLRSDPAKATIRAIVCVTMTSKVPHGDLLSIVWLPNASPLCPESGTNNLVPFFYKKSDLQ